MTPDAFFLSGNSRETTFVLNIMISLDIPAARSADVDVGEELISPMVAKQT